MTDEAKPPILNIKMVPGGVELVITALRKLPHDQVDPLVQELWAQYKDQMTAIAQEQLSEPEPKQLELPEGSDD